MSIDLWSPTVHVDANAACESGQNPNCGDQLLLNSPAVETDKLFINPIGQVTTGGEFLHGLPGVEEVPKALTEQERRTKELCTGKATQQMGGCDARAMSDQGRTRTSGTEATHIPKGSALIESVSQAISTSTGTVLGDSVGAGKRVAVFLNVSLQPPQVKLLEAQGVTALSVLRFGAFQEPVSTLMRVKKLIREGRVVWLHGRVTPQQWTNPTWFTQCSRMAHRASAPWSLEFKRAPWHIKPFEALRRHKYVQSLSPSRDPQWYGSEQVIAPVTELGQILDQIANRALASSEGALWLDEIPTNNGGPSKKQLRAKEDLEAIGGLRSPHKSIDKLPRAAQLGEWIRTLILAETSEEMPPLVAALNTLGKGETPQLLCQKARAIRARMCKELGLAEGPEQELQGQLIAQLAERMGDPDQPVQNWLRRGAVPLGITKPITPGGIFPCAELSHSEGDQDLQFWLDNYGSYNEHRAGAEAILAREREKGWLEWSPTREPLDRKYGPITQNRIGVIAKQKGDQLKLRLIHDLKRSGVNAKVQFQERLILPRLSDAKDDVLHAIKEAGHDNWECVVLDHADAFKQLRVEESERSHLGGRALNGWFVYACVLFGVKSGPLLWGRHAALIMRLTSALTGNRARAQCFVDDPLLTVWGTESQRDSTLLAIILFWLAIGCRLSWGKGCRGRRVEWIGAVLQPWLSATLVPGLTLTITEDKVAKLAHLCDEILGAQVQVSRGKIRRLAGLATWIAGIMPQITAYTARLWAASATSAEYVAAHQLRPTVMWLRRLCNDNLQRVQRHCREQPGYFTLITFDAALTGGGATLQAGLKSIEDAATKPMLAYWHTHWEAEDYNLLKVTKDDPSGQAALEAYTLLISVATWSKVLEQAQGALHVRGDALGVLYNMLRLKSKDPVLNAIAGELAHLVAPLGLDIRAAHVWSERNDTCDHLSRLKVGESCERPELRHALRVTRVQKPKFWLRNLA